MANRETEREQRIFYHLADRLVSQESCDQYPNQLHVPVRIKAGMSAEEIRHAVVVETDHQIELAEAKGIDLKGYLITVSLVELDARDLQ